MPKVNDKQLAVARTYSRALLEVAEKKGSADAVLEQLQWLAGHAEENEEFGRFVANPLIDPSVRSASFEKMFRGRLDDVLVDGLGVMSRKGRVGLLATLAETYLQEHRDLRGRVEVQIATAVPLSAELRSRIEKLLAERTGKTPEIHESVDEGLIGGIVLRIGDRKVDATVKNEVRKYRKLLDDLAAREILGSREDALIED
ncbi:MAG: ATP synthase F1 subunit delta [Holophagales bacterium]|nr:ATP synthase F1 subunit delta [Holophagales bacterium]